MADPDLKEEDDEDSVGVFRGGKAGLILGPNMSFEGLDCPSLSKSCFPADSSRGGVDRGRAMRSATGVETGSSGLKERLRGESLLPINLDLVGVVAPALPPATSGPEKADPSLFFFWWNSSDKFAPDLAFFKTSDLEGENRLIRAGSSLEIPTPSERGRRASADRRVDRKGRRGGWRVSCDMKSGLLLGCGSPSTSDGAV